MRWSLLLLLSACAARSAPSPMPMSTQLPPTVSLDRADFNRVAMALGHPVFWAFDADGEVQPDELVQWWMPGRQDPYVAGGLFSPRGASAVAEIREALRLGFQSTSDDPSELARAAAVRAELAYGRPTLLKTDLTTASETDRALVTHLMEAAAGIERLHELQQGTVGLQAPDAASEMVVWRNHGPQCVTPAGEGVAECRPVPGETAPALGIYPPSVQQEAGFCEQLDEALMTPFTVVRVGDEGLVAVPYQDAWPQEMSAVAASLRLAAEVLGDDEGAFANYLGAAADAFEDGDWFAADAAWAVMNAQNSRWYLRVGPDETYWEPCSRKAGFHMSFARINPASVAWQDKLEPVKAQMEAELARIAGPPYVARDVAFTLPDFIDIVLNAGDSRDPIGATIGQSLPNWGPVADAGGRTVAMTNLFLDDDSLQAHDAQVASLICPASLGPFADGVEPLLMSTVLHEAAHNLGPSHAYAVDGKTDEEAFGGPLASTFEELKAQTAALYFSDWLVEKGVVEREFATRAHAADIAWSLGKISSGMYTADGLSKAYPQLASIQMGYLHERGVLAWKPDQIAANGVDAGCFEVDFVALPEAIASLSGEVFSIKATADRARAEALKQAYVDAEGAWRGLAPTIEERWQRQGAATMVYAVEL